MSNLQPDIRESSGPKLLIAATIAPTVTAFLLPFGHYFRRQGWRVDALSTNITAAPDCVDAFDRVWDIDWSRNPLDVRNFRETPRRIRELVAREGYDLVHVHTPVAAFVTRYALRNRGAKPRLVYTAHGFHFYRGAPATRNLVYRTLERIAGRWTDALIVINREDEQAARRYRIVREDRVHYMPGIGVDTSVYRADTVDAGALDRLRDELGLGPGEALFLMIAEFNPGKRHYDALIAFARMKNRGAHLAFAGLGPLMPEIKELAAQLGVSDRTHFLGFRQDIPVLVRASTATLLPSDREGLPRSVLESLALGVPVIGSDIRGVRDLIADGCGRLVAVGDMEALAQAMDWMLEHPDEARAMGERGRARVAAFDVRHVIEMHEKLYGDLLAGG